jgi:hypothetical protein
MNHRACDEHARAKGKLLNAGPFHVPGLPEPVWTTAYLPPGYDESGATHSLAVFFDGQNMFDDEGSFSGRVGAPNAIRPGNHPVEPAEPPRQGRQAT